jgi:type II secretory pathway pseudopilin PulG
MTMLPQPPPNAPAPPPSETALRSQRLWRWIWVTGVISILLLLVLLAPLTLRSRKNVVQTEAVSNARQIGIALIDFESEFGKFPDAIGSAVTSNEVFRQLFIANLTGSERMFYARISGAKKPDDNITGVELLKKGECSFTYFMGAKATDIPGRPLVVTPMIPGTDRFDPNPFKGKAVVLRLDNSVTSVLIDKDGHVMLGGRNMMDPGHPIWGGPAPAIAWPDL